MAAATDTTYALTQGKVYMASRIANGAINSGYLWVGDADKVEISTTQKFDDIEESYTGNRLVAAHAPIGTSLNFKINCLQIDTANLQKAYYATYAGAVTGASVVAELITLYNGAMTPLANPGVSAVVAVKVAGSVAEVIGTDITVDAANGTITVLPASTVVPAGAGVPSSVNYTFGTYTGKIEPFTTAIVEFSIFVAGFNIMNGNAPFLARLHRVSMNMAKMLSLIDNKHIALELDGMLLPDSTQAAGKSQFFQIVKA